MIAGLLLAAGAARRFGAQKLTQDLAGRPVIRWSAEALGGCVDQTLVVVPPDRTGIADALHGIDLRFVTNPRPERGLGTSIACGVAALPPDADAVIVTLGDEPALDPRWIDAVIGRYRASRGAASIVAPVFHGTQRHPVLFDRAIFPELAALDGDRGARRVIDRDAGRVAHLEVDAPGTIDVDTPEDLARLGQSRQFTARQSPRTP